jgi:hypothetical protein
LSTLALVPGPMPLMLSRSATLALFTSTAAMAHDVAKAKPTAMMRLNMLCSPLDG